MGFAVVLVLYTIFSLVLLLVFWIATSLILRLKFIRHPRLRKFLRRTPLIVASLPFVFLGIWMYSINHMSPSDAYRGIYGVESGPDIMDLQADTQGINDFQLIYLSFFAPASHATLFQASPFFKQVEKESQRRFLHPYSSDKPPSWWAPDDCGTIQLFAARKPQAFAVDYNIIIVAEVAYDWDEVTVAHCLAKNIYYVQAVWID